MENFLLKYMSQMLFLFSGIVFLVWLFQFIEIPYIEGLQISFLKTYKYEGVISTFQMFTTLGAIFAFWFGYKKYQIENELENYNKFLVGELTIDDFNNINKWVLAFEMRKINHISKTLFNYINISNTQVLIAFLNENLLVDTNEYIEVKAEKLAHGFGNLRIYESFYKYILDFLEEYLKELSKIISIENNDYEKAKLKNIRLNLKLLLECFAEADDTYYKP